ATVTNNFTVQNTGGGTLTGTATVAAPFYIASGGTYSLTNNQTQTVLISYSPSGAATDSQTVTFTGGGGTGATVSGSLASTNPSIYVTPSALNFGVVMAGATVTNNFTVQNTGGGTLTGTATVAAPFYIASGGTYSLTNNQTQTVLISYSPSGAATDSGTVSCAGGGGATASVSGQLVA